MRPDQQGPAQAVNWDRTSSPYGWPVTGTGLHKPLTAASFSTYGGPRARGRPKQEAPRPARLFGRLCRALKRPFGKDGREIPRPASRSRGACV